MRVQEPPLSSVPPANSATIRNAYTGSRRPARLVLAGFVAVLLVGPVHPGEEEERPTAGARLRRLRRLDGLADRRRQRANPTANDRRALNAGRDAYTGSCSVCHGASGNGRGVFGTSSYPNATDLRSHDAAEKSDAQLFLIIKNGLNFTGMPGFADQYSDQDIWSMVSYIRALQNPDSVPTGGNGRGFGGFQLQPVTVPAATMDQLDRANALSTDASARGAAVYFAQGCQLCHGPVGDAPANLGLARGRPEGVRANQHRPGMPTYSTSQLSDSELSDLQAYSATIGSTRRRGD